MYKECLLSSYKIGAEATKLLDVGIHRTRVLSTANIRINFTSPETRVIVIHLDTIPECDGQTDGIPLTIACTN